MSALAKRASSRRFGGATFYILAFGAGAFRGHTGPGGRVNVWTVSTVVGSIVAMDMQQRATIVATGGGG